MSINPINIIQQGKSYFSQGASYLRSPTKLLAGTSLGWLANTTLSKVEGRGDPLLSSNWTVIMPEIPVAQKINETLLSSVADGLGMANRGLDKVSGWADNSTVSSITSTIKDGLSTASDYLNKANKALTEVSQKISLGDEYVETIELVNKEYGERQTFRGGIYRKYPDGIVTIPDLTMTFYGDVNIESFKYLQNWLDLVQGASSETFRNGGWVTPYMYKKTITVGVADDNLNNLYLIDYIGCWLKSMQPLDLDNTGDNRLIYNATFSVDDVRVYGYDVMSFTDMVLNYAGEQALNSTWGKQLKSSYGKVTDTVNNVISTGLTGII